MSRDRYAVIWTRAPSGALKMGSLVATANEVRFSYSKEFLEQTETAGLTLLLPASVLRDQPFVWAVTEAMPLIPRLMALLPGRNPRNVQRRYYVEMLARREHPPAPGFDTDWELLMMAGRGGIGHIDVFEDDRDALFHYAHPFSSPVKISGRSEIWRYIRDEAKSDLADDGIEMLKLLGPTPSVGGMIPKLLASIPDRPRWSGEISAPGTRMIGEEPFTDAVVKIEYPEYQGLGELESLCLDIHKEIGFDVPRHWLSEVDGLRVLAIERFDRTKGGLPIPMESFYSAYALGRRTVRSSTDPEMEDLYPMLRKLAEVAGFDAAAIAHEVYRRFLAAVFTGNGDLHLENLAFLGGPKNIRLAPVYDPSPMRAWDRHNLLSALSFEIDEKYGLGGSIERLGVAFGLSKTRSREHIEEIGEKTSRYIDRVMELKTVPDEQKTNLARAVSDIRKKILS